MRGERKNTNQGETLAQYDPTSVWFGSKHFFNVVSFFSIVVFMGGKIFIKKAHLMNG